MTQTDVLCVVLEGLYVLLEYIISDSAIYARIALVGFKRVVVGFKRILAFLTTANQCGQDPVVYKKLGIFY